MHIENSIIIRGDPHRIFQAAADVENWPLFLKHYPSVRILERDRKNCLFAIAGRRWGIKVRWTAFQKIDPLKYEIRFEHVKGFAKGVEAHWTFVRTRDGMRVHVTHSMARHRPQPLRLLTEDSVYPFFLGYFTERTLRGLKRHIDQLEKVGPV